MRSALIAGALPAEQQVRSRALLRSVMNAGLVVGSTGAAVALQANTYAGYVTMTALDAASFLGATALLVGLPLPSEAEGRAPGATTAPRRTALRDLRYLVVTALHAVLELQLAVLTVGIPLWIVLGTDAPTAVVAAVNVVNCLLVVLFQVRASRGVDSIPTAARACARGGVVLAAACLVYAAAGHGPAAVAAATVLVGALVHSLGELLTSAGGWTLSLEPADPRSHGEYQGVFMSGQAAAHVLGPMVISLTVVAHGVLGWSVLAALFALAGVALVPAFRVPAPRGPASRVPVPGRQAG